MAAVMVLLAAALVLAWRQHRRVPPGFAQA
jgi:hypothetical protein